MKKKVLILGILFALAVNVFAQAYDYFKLSDCAGVCISYKDDSGHQLNMVNIDAAYMASYFDEEKLLIGVLDIKKGWNTEISLVKVFEGTEEEINSILIPAFKELFLYGDFGNREKVAAGLKSEKKDMNDNLLSYALMDFYIPITNVIGVYDAEGNAKYRCVYLGMLSPDDLYDFIVADIDYEGAVERDMKKVKVQKGQKTKVGNVEVSLPKNFVYNESVEAYVLNDTTKMDSAIQGFTINLGEYELADLNAYVYVDLYSAQGFIIPDSIRLDKIGNAQVVKYDYISPEYGEYNTHIMALYENGENIFEAVSINGYRSFINLNYDMYVNMIKSGKLVK